MTLDRSWLRRPLVSAPYFGKSIPAIWAETQVTIERSEPVKNATGGIEGSGPRTLATVMAHVELQVEGAGGKFDLISGPLVRRYYTVIIPPEIEGVVQFPAGNPRKGDTLTFTDPTGMQITSPVCACDMPEGIADHWELETERFE